MDFSIRKGAGAQRPHCPKGRDPRTPASWRHLLLWHARGGQTVDEVRPTSLPSSSVTVLWKCLQFLDKFDTLLRLTAVVCSSTRWSMSLLCCAMVPHVQSVNHSVAYEMHVTSMTHRIACLRLSSPLRFLISPGCRFRACLNRPENKLEQLRSCLSFQRFFFHIQRVQGAPG